MAVNLPASRTSLHHILIPTTSRSSSSFSIAPTPSPLSSASACPSLLWSRSSAMSPDSLIDDSVSHTPLSPSPMRLFCLSDLQLMSSEAAASAFPADGGLPEASDVKNARSEQPSQLQTRPIVFRYEDPPAPLCPSSSSRALELSSDVDLTGLNPRLVWPVGVPREMLSVFRADPFAPRVPDAPFQRPAPLPDVAPVACEGDAKRRKLDVPFLATGPEEMYVHEFRVDIGVERPQRALRPKVVAGLDERMDVDGGGADVGVKTAHASAPAPFFFETQARAAPMYQAGIFQFQHLQRPAPMHGASQVAAQNEPRYTSAHSLWPVPGPAAAARPSQPQPQPQLQPQPQSRPARRTKSSNNTSGRRYQCPKCPRTFGMPNGLTLHSKWHERCEAAGVNIVSDEHVGGAGKEVQDGRAYAAQSAHRGNSAMQYYRHQPIQSIPHAGSELFVPAAPALYPAPFGAAEPRSGYPSRQSHGAPFGPEFAGPTYLAPLEELELSPIGAHNG